MLSERIASLSDCVPRARVMHRLTGSFIGCSSSVLHDYLTDVYEGELDASHASPATRRDGSVFVVLPDSSGQSHSQRPPSETDTGWTLTQPGESPASSPGSGCRRLFSACSRYCRPVVESG
ncbi:hypothetical protein C8039_01125 [Halogeometricum sp. wsp3]|nr:hypothetical protein C8039_01125 [Halogeometricum sp. wsp3]